MTIEQLLECSAAQLAAMTDEELLEHFKPYFNVTRPELAVKPKTPSAANLTISKEELSALKQDFDKLAKLGIKLDWNEYIRKFKKKK